MKRSLSIAILLVLTAFIVFEAVQLIGWGHPPFRTTGASLAFEQIRLLLVAYILCGSSAFIAAMFLLIRDRGLAAIASFIGLVLLSYGTFYIAFTLAFEF